MSTLLSCKNVTFAYRGARAPALDGIDVHVDRGEFVGIVGATGAGKSTLVRCASGIVPKFFRGPFRGEVQVHGESIAHKRIADLCGQVGTMFQDFESQLFSTNARLECAFGMENLGLDRATMRERIETVSRQVGLDGLLDRDPHTLSGGQKQRLALASVLCLKPDLLLCDEPTTDLDPVGRQQLFDALGSLSRDRHGVVLVEHETERLVHADRVVVLRQGRVAAEGRAADVLADPAFCLRNGVQCPQMFELCARLGLPDRPVDVPAARAALARAGMSAKAGAAFADRSEPGGASLIELSGVSFHYTPDKPVLRDVNLGIRRGDFVALLGQNGSGKTTLVKHAMGLLTPRFGEVRFDGAAITRADTARLGARVGFVFQDPDHMLFAATVFDEVAFGLSNRKVPPAELPRRVAVALETVGLGGREQTDPFVMTKGERQKLAVACVLACEPEVLVLDEPTTGLDAAEQVAMMQLLARLNSAGHTVIIITHAMDVAATWARRVVLMRGGEIIADGTARQVFHQPDRLALAGLVAPPCVRLGSLLGVPAVTVDELAGALERRPA
jgi:energy-coupling factor transporter ATP-binding protein EcfA2